jgi:hypothetical protein
MAMALVTMAAASSDGGKVDPTVTKSVTTGAAGPFMAAAMGFAAFLMAAGLVTLRTRVFARWTGIVAIIGAVSFLITFLVVLDGTTDGSPFGYASSQGPSRSSPGRRPPVSAPTAQRQPSSLGEAAV